MKCILFCVTLDICEISDRNASDSPIVKKPNISLANRLTIVCLFCVSVKSELICQKMKDTIKL